MPDSDARAMLEQLMLIDSVALSACTRQDGSAATQEAAEEAEVTLTWYLANIAMCWLAYDCT